MPYSYLSLPPSFPPSLPPSSCKCLLGLDQFLFITLLYLHTRVSVRRLHDATFGRVPLLSSILAWSGGVRGTRNSPLTSPPLPPLVPIRLRPISVHHASLPPHWRLHPSAARCNVWAGAPPFFHPCVEWRGESHEKEHRAHDGDGGTALVLPGRIRGELQEEGGEEVQPAVGGEAGVCDAGD